MNDMKSPCFDLNLKWLMTLYIAGTIIRWLAFSLVPSIGLGGGISSIAYNLAFLHLASLACGLWLYKHAKKNKFIWLCFGVSSDLFGVILFIIIYYIGSAGSKAPSFPFKN